MMQTDAAVGCRLLRSRIRHEELCGSHGFTSKSGGQWVATARGSESSYSEH